MNREAAKHLFPQAILV